MTAIAKNAAAVNVTDNAIDRVIAEAMKEFRLACEVQATAKVSAATAINTIMKQCIEELCAMEKPKFARLQGAINEIADVSKTYARKIVKDLPAYLGMEDILLIADISRDSNVPIYNIFYKDYSAMVKALKAVCANIENLAPFMEWHKEKDKLPESEKRVKAVDSLEKALKKSYKVDKLNSDMARMIAELRKMVKV